MLSYIRKDESHGKPTTQAPPATGAPTAAAAGDRSRQRAHARAALRQAQLPLRLRAGHRATYLTVSFARGRTEQISLPATLVAQAQTWVANYQAWWEAVEAISAINRELLRRRRASSSKSAPPPRRRRARTPRS